VSQNNIDQGQAAETKTQEDKTFIRQVRSASSWKGSAGKWTLVTSADERGSSQAFSMPAKDPSASSGDASWKRGKSGSPGTG